MFGSVNYIRDPMFFKRPELIFFAIISVLIWQFFNILYADPDLFARVAVGRLIVLTGEVPLLDPFAFTPKKPLWVDHEWLAGYVFYYLSQFGGDPLLFLAKIFFAVLSFVLLEKTQRLMHDGEIKSAPLWLLYAAIKCSFVWVSTIRAQVFTYLFFPYLLYALALYYRKGNKLHLWFLPLTFLVWANAHGGFVSGLGIFAVFILGITIDKKSLPWTLIFSFSLSLLAPAINPYGLIEYWQYILHAITMPRPEIPEWKALGIFTPVALGVHIVVASLIFGLYRKRDNLQFALILPILVTIYYAYKHERLLALFVMAAITLGIKYLEEIPLYIKAVSEKWYRAFSEIGGAILILLTPFLLIPLIKFIINFNSFRLDYSEYPVAAIEWLWQNGNGGKVLVDFSNGSYALWRLYPKYLISLDGRYEEVYPEATAKIVTEALSFSGTESLNALRELNPDYILYYSDILNDQRVAGYLSGWRKIYDDKQYAIFSMKGEAPYQQLDDEGKRAHSQYQPIWSSRF